VSKAKRRLTAAGRLADRHEIVQKEERRAAICALLRNPLLSVTNNGDAFRTVRLHAHWLRKWFLRWPNWSLIVTADVARLRKHPSPRKDSTRGLLDKSSSVERTHFTRRQYALLCIVLAIVESEGRQTTIQQIARKTEVFVRVHLHDTHFTFDPKVLANRRELVAVMRFLQQHVLVRSDGDDQGYVHGESDCLYRINRASLAMILCSSKGASTVSAVSLDDFVEGLNAIETPAFTDAQNRELQNRLVRRLLDDPVMYFDELTVQEYQYFNDQAERLTRELHRATGMIVERRAEGVALLDPEGCWTDLGMPETGTRGHLTLLLAEWFGERLRDEGDHVIRIQRSDVLERVTELTRIHETRWRKNANTPEGIKILANESLELLQSLALIEVDGKSVIPRPAVARYSLGEIIQSNSVKLNQARADMEMTAP
jgi:uncharacterized protein (TIGR02678 family)